MTPPLNFTIMEALWLTLQAITSVGFGDIVITSPRGRIVAGFAAVAGISETALLVMAVGELLFMDSQSTRLMHADLRYGRIPILRDDAARYIQRVWKHYLAAKKSMQRCVLCGGEKKLYETEANKYCFLTLFLTLFFLTLPAQLDDARWCRRQCQHCDAVAEAAR
jgi:hypothetical protein